MLAYSGDTDACDGLDAAAAGADLLLCEAAFVEGRDHGRGVHLTGRRAGEAAARAGAGRLVLTHVPAWNPPGAAVAEAAQVYDGDVVAARARRRCTRSTLDPGDAPRAAAVDWP